MKYVRQSWTWFLAALWCIFVLLLHRGFGWIDIGLIIGTVCFVWSALICQFIWIAISH